MHFTSRKNFTFVVEFLCKEMTKLSLQKSILIRQIEMRIYVHNVSIFSNLKPTAWAPVLEAWAPHKIKSSTFWFDHRLPSNRARQNVIF